MAFRLGHRAKPLLRLTNLLKSLGQVATEAPGLQILDLKQCSGHEMLRTDGLEAPRMRKIAIRRRQHHKIRC